MIAPTISKEAFGNADELQELRRLEKEKGIQPDPEIDAFMKANAIEGKRESIETEYVLHILGLGICADTLVKTLLSISSFFCSPYICKA